MGDLDLDDRRHEGATAVQRGRPLVPHPGFSAPTRQLSRSSGPVVYPLGPDCTNRCVAKANPRAPKGAGIPRSGRLVAMAGWSNSQVRGVALIPRALDPGQNGTWVTEEQFEQVIDREAAVVQSDLVLREDHQVHRPGR